MENHSLEEFPEHLRPFAVRALRKGDDSFWAFKAPVPANPGNAVLFSGCYERLDAECMIPKPNYHRYQLGEEGDALIIWVLFIFIRFAGILLCILSISEAFKYENPLYLFYIIFAFIF
jgi:hypothetical protein